MHDHSRFQHDIDRRHKRLSLSPSLSLYYYYDYHYYYYDVDKCLNQSFGLNLSKGLPNRCTVGSKWDHWRVLYNHDSQMSCSLQLESENKIKKEKIVLTSPLASFCPRVA